MKSLLAAVALSAAAVGMSCGGSGETEGVVLTYYWIPLEADFGCPQKGVALKTCDGETVATVCPEFAESARMEGTAKLENGELINLDCDCGGGFSCFARLDAAEYPWGMGSDGNPLAPFVSVATNDSRWPFGTRLYLKEFDGLGLRGPSKHNGCVRVDDVGWSFGENQIDFFAGTESSYHAIDDQLGIDTVTVSEEPDCALLEYQP